VRIVQGGSPAAHQWLAHRSPRAHSARAITTVRVISLDVSLLELMLSSACGAGCQIEEFLAGSEAAAQDWEGRIARLPGSHLIPAANLQQLFTAMRDVRYDAGEAVFQQGDESTHFYIIKSGRCEIIRERVSGAPLKLSTLGPGDVFGQDALIAGTPRSATCRMLTEGVIAQVGLRDFRALLEGPLLQRMTPRDGEHLVKAGRAVWLDVRLPADRGPRRLPDDVHVPLELLRRRLQSLDRSKIHLAYCDTGKRAAVAAFTLRGWGFDAYAVSGALALLDDKGPGERLMRRVRAEPTGKDFAGR